ncbi:MAG: recombinase family protein [Roseburia sp.]|nr:recombinase family protein [Roseburia sp.]
MIYGYCRCSTNESKQDIDRQINTLKAAGADAIHFEYEHGDAEHKKELERLIAATSPGDTILTMEVSRLARSTRQLCDLIDIVKDKHLKLVILGSLTVDCTNGELDPMTKAFLQISGVFAELELCMIRSRVKSGMANAKAKGAVFGRPRTTIDKIPAAFFKFYPAFRSKKMNATEFARISGIGRTTLYKYLKIVENGSVT